MDSRSTDLGKNGLLWLISVSASLAHAVSFQDPYEILVQTLHGRGTSHFCRRKNTLLVSVWDQLLEVAGKHVPSSPELGAHWPQLWWCHRCTPGTLPTAIPWWHSPWVSQRLEGQWSSQRAWLWTHAVPGSWWMPSSVCLQAPSRSASSLTLGPLYRTICHRWGYRESRQFEGVGRHPWQWDHSALCSQCRSGCCHLSLSLKPQERPKDWWMPVWLLFRACCWSPPSPFGASQMGVFLEVCAQGGLSLCLSNVSPGWYAPGLSWSRQNVLVLLEKISKAEPLFFW